MTSTMKIAELDYGATPQRLEKMAIGKILKSLVVKHDREVDAAHIVGDNTNLVTVAKPVVGSLTNEADAILYVADLKAQINAHFLMPAYVHPLGADATNAMVIVPVAWATVYTLLDEIKHEFNDHLALCAGTGHLQATTRFQITHATATSPATAQTFMEEVFEMYELHRLNALTNAVAVDALLENIGRAGV